MLLHFWKFNHFRFTSHFVPVQSDESSWLFDGFRVKIHRHAWVLTGSNPWTRIFLFRKVIFNQKLFYAFGLTGKLNFVFSCWQLTANWHQLTAISNFDVTRPMIELLKHIQYNSACAVHYVIRCQRNEKIRPHFAFGAGRRRNESHHDDNYWSDMKINKCQDNWNITRSLKKKTG